MIARTIENMFFHYEGNRVKLGLGIDENGRDMVKDVVDNGLRKGIPMALTRHNEHFIGPHGDDISDRFEEIIIIGLHSILAGMVLIFGKNLNYFLPKKTTTS